MPLETPRKTPPVCVGVPVQAETPDSLSEYMCTQSVRSVKSHGSPRTVVAKSAPGWLVCADAPPIVNDCAAPWAANPSTKSTVAAYRPSRRIVVCLTITTCIPARLSALPRLPRGSVARPMVLQAGAAPHTAGRSIGTPGTLDELVCAGPAPRKRAGLHVP